jgi:beta-1,4-glucosyltransferase
MKKPVFNKVLPLAGFSILSTTADSLCACLNNVISKKMKITLLFANSNFILKCKHLQSWINSDDVILVNDGIGLDIAALLKHGQCFNENLNGTDFSPLFLSTLPEGINLFLLGGKHGIAEKAARVIESRYIIKVVGFLDGYSKIQDEVIIEKINSSKANIVMVAMGNPLQEQWIHDHLKFIDANLFIGVGALFDFLTLEVARAPKWVQRIRCEWLFRLIQEPRRLLRRYTLDVMSFLWICLRHPG